MSRIRVSLLTTLLFVLASTYFGAELARAVPSFARQNGLPCSTCHTQWPQLNDYGREFKESGYNTAEDTEEIADFVSLDKTFPASAVVNMRFFDKRTSKTTTAEELTDKDKMLKLRAGHELEAFFAGRASENISFFAELEAEDEWPDPNGDAPGFQVQVAAVVGAYHFGNGITISGGFASPFYADPYNTLYHHKMFRKDWWVSGNLPNEAQFISVSGRPVPQLFLLAALSGNDGDLEGHDPRDYSFRVAVDPVPGVMVGGFANFSKRYNGATGRSKDKFYRTGADFQIDRADVHINGVLSRWHDFEADWRGTLASVEAQYICGERPTIVPYLVLDLWNVDKEASTLTGFGVFLTYFLKENAKAQIGVEGLLTAAKPYDYEHKEKRWTLVGVFGF